MRTMQGVALVVLTLLPQIAEVGNSPQPMLVLANVTVIDATGAPAKPDMTVLITGDRITAVGPSRTVDVPTDAQIVRAKGKYLIPGLWDMHFHTVSDPKNLFPLLVANGVTGIRDMGTSVPLEQIRKWRNEIASGTLLGPRIVAAGRMLDGPHALFPEISTVVATPSEARQAVDSLKSGGADFIKIQSMLGRAAYFSVAAEAKAQRLPFAGHVPASVRALEASDSGQRSIEHLTGILLSCSRRETGLMRQLTDAVENQTTTTKTRIRLLFLAPPKQILDSYSERKAAKLFARFASNGTWQVPTLIMWHGFAFLDHNDLAGDVRLKYIPLDLKEHWNTKDAVGEDFTPADFANLRNLFRKHIEVVGAMHRAGVRFMAGTDTPNPFCLPGFGVHDELKLLVGAGLTPLEAIQAATRNPAEYLGESASLGTIKEDKIADLVLLDANPLEDIGNTQKIAAVVLGGKFIPTSALQKMLADMERANNEK
jgi:imidazolonepropionase-like amidohydrolase